MRRSFIAALTLVALPASPALVAANAGAAEITVSMDGAAYQPVQVNAAVGDTLRFVNNDTVKHDVFVPTADHAFDLGALEPGEERRLTLRKAGTFEVECVFHPEMLSKVEVK